MPSIFDRVDARNAYPVDETGGAVCVAEPTYEEIDRINALTGEDRHGLTLALCIVTPEGQKAFQPADGETDTDFGKRVLLAAKSLRPSHLKAISSKLEELLKPVKSEDIAKN